MSITCAKNTHVFEQYIMQMLPKSLRCLLSLLDLVLEIIEIEIPG